MNFINFFKKKEKNIEIQEAFKTCSNCKNAKWRDALGYSFRISCKYCGEVSSNGICSNFIPSSGIIKFIKELEKKEKHGYKEQK